MSENEKIQWTIDDGKSEYTTVVDGLVTMLPGETEAYHILHADTDTGRHAVACVSNWRIAIDLPNVTGKRGESIKITLNKPVRHFDVVGGGFTHIELDPDPTSCTATIVIGEYEYAQGMMYRGWINKPNGEPGEMTSATIVCTDAATLIIPSEKELVCGETYQFRANKPGTWLWDIEKKRSAETTISNDGLLHVGWDEVAEGGDPHDLRILMENASGTVVAMATAHVMFAPALSPSSARIPRGKSITINANFDVDDGGWSIAPMTGVTVFDPAKRSVLIDFDDKTAPLTTYRVYARRATMSIAADIELYKGRFYISPQDPVKIAQGGTFQFQTPGEYEKDCSWYVRGASDVTGTYIRNGLLTVGDAEPTTTGMPIIVEAESPDTLSADAAWVQVVSIIQPDHVILAPGGAAEFRIDDSVEGTVAWSVKGEDIAERTVIAANGRLTIDANQPVGSAVQVKAVVEGPDGSVRIGYADVGIEGALVITPRAVVELRPNDTYQFHANINDGIEWHVAADARPGTVIDDTGLLTVAYDQAESFDIDAAVPGLAPAYAHVNIRPVLAVDKPTAVIKRGDHITIRTNRTGIVSGFTWSVSGAVDTSLEPSSSGDSCTVYAGNSETGDASGRIAVTVASGYGESAVSDITILNPADVLAFDRLIYYCAPGASVTFVLNRSVSDVRLELDTPDIPAKFVGFTCYIPYGLYDDVSDDVMVTATDLRTGEFALAHLFLRPAVVNVTSDAHLGDIGYNNRIWVPRAGGSVTLPIVGTDNLGWDTDVDVHFAATPALVRMDRHGVGAPVFVQILPETTSSYLFPVNAEIQLTGGQHLIRSDLCRICISERRTIVPYPYPISAELNAYVPRSADEHPLGAAWDKSISYAYESGDVGLGWYMHLFATTIRADGRVSGTTTFLASYPVADFVFNPPRGIEYTVEYDQCIITINAIYPRDCYYANASITWADGARTRYTFVVDSIGLKQISDPDYGSAYTGCLVDMWKGGDNTITFEAGAPTVNHARWEGSSSTGELWAHEGVVGARVNGEFVLVGGYYKILLDDDRDLMTTTRLLITGEAVIDFPDTYVPKGEPLIAKFKFTPRLWTEYADLCLVDAHVSVLTTGFDEAPLIHYEVEKGYILDVSVIPLDGDETVTISIAVHGQVKYTKTLRRAD